MPDPKNNLEIVTFVPPERTEGEEALFDALATWLAEHVPAKAELIHEFTVALAQQYAERGRGPQATSHFWSNAYNALLGQAQGWQRQDVTLSHLRLPSTAYNDPLSAWQRSLQAAVTPCLLVFCSVCGFGWVQAQTPTEKSRYEFRPQEGYDKHHISIDLTLYDSTWIYVELVDETRLQDVPHVEWMELLTGEHQQESLHVSGTKGFAILLGPGVYTLKIYTEINWEYQQGTESVYVQRQPLRAPPRPPRKTKRI